MYLQKFEGDRALRVTVPKRSWQGGMAFPKVQEKVAFTELF